MVINPYLNFNGNTEEVFNFYKSIFGGDFPFVMRFNEIPKDAVDGEGCVGEDIQESDANGLAHIALPIGQTMLMASDVPSNMPPVTSGNNVSLCLSVDNRADADRIFAALSDGGKVQMPMQDQFWGDYYGMLEDRFKIQWAISFNEAQDGKAAQ